MYLLYYYPFNIYTSHVILRITPVNDKIMCFLYVHKYKKWLSKNVKN